jgi:protocatechuate 4,5-dioxygenase, beta chain
MWPEKGAWPVKIVPISINTVQHPLPSLDRCLNLGRSVGRALDAYSKDIEIVVVGTGGLSHQLDGERAGFINKSFDLLCMDQLLHNPDALTRYSIPEFIEQAGAQGVEFLNWMAMRGALTGTVSEAHRNITSRFPTPLQRQWYWRTSRWQRRRTAAHRVRTKAVVEAA